MTPTTVAEVFKRNSPKNKNFWKNDLELLGIEPEKRENIIDFNGKSEIEELVEIIKQDYYRDYKTAYNGDRNQG